MAMPENIVISRFLLSLALLQHQKTDSKPVYTDNNNSR